MHRCVSLRSTAMCFFALILIGVAPIAAEEVAYWPDDHDDQLLRELDDQVLTLQKKRFQAIFAENRDEAELERIRQEFRQAQKARRELLRRTGRH